MKRILLIILLLALPGCGKKTAHYGSWSIGRDPTWFPVQIELLIPNLNGFTNALVDEIATTEDVPLQLINFEWGQLFNALDAGEVAGIFTALSPNLIAQEKYSFSEPFLLLGPVLVVPENSEATSLEDLEGKIVSVNQYDESVLLVQKYPSIVIKLYQQKPKVLEELKDGTIDAVLMPVLDAQALVSHVYPGHLKIASAPLNNKGLRLVTQKGKNQSLIKHFNSGLNHARSSGKYDELRKKFQLS